MNLVLDAGALIGLESADQRVAQLIALARRAGSRLVTGAPVVAQVWRGGARQANLARALPMIDVVPMAEGAAKAVGELLAVAGASDVVDAFLASTVRPGDKLLTSDPHDLHRLLVARKVKAVIVRV